MITDYYYQNILRKIHEEGDLIETRNYLCKSCFDLDPIIFTKTPLVTIRKTAWKKALRELEWFMSGDKTCPEELLDWWKGQLDEHGHYHRGYSEQLRFSRMPPHYGIGFDQIKYILNGLRNNPNSRRLVMTTWNPWDMANIIMLNNNAMTPSCCHGSLIQLFVREGRVHMTHYQRSADMLLGIIHNWCQYWALLMYFAYQSNLKVGSLRYIIGDAHLYSELSHNEVVKAIINCDLSTRLDSEPELVYNGDIGSDFRASDFEIIGEIQNPVTTIRPKLL